MKVRMCGDGGRHTMDGNGGPGRPGHEAPWRVPGYTEERELGAGASGRVVLARHDATGTAVAVKYLSGGVGREEGFREAFRGEARLLGGLDSPWVARFYEYVEDGPDAAIVMEPVDGIALRTLLRQEGATDPEPALAVLKGSLLGLAAAHEAGVVHRDYKPANVIVTTEGRSKLVDFGVAVRSGEAGGVAGTPSYMAPEQWAGGPATPATDVYAATATFYECLTGSKPYRGATAIELAVQHAEAPIPNEQVPEPVRPLIRRGLAKTPQERPQSATEFVAELEAAATAGYGAGWEERGQRKLAALVALLPLLLPSAGAPASGTTALARTEWGPGAAVAGTAAGALRRYAAGAARRPRTGRRARLLLGAAVVAAVSAGLAVTAVATGGGGPSADDAATVPSALTSLTSGPPPAPASATPAPASPSASPSLSGTPPTATGTATATATATTAPSTTPPSPSATATGATATATATTATTSPTTSAPPQPLHVTSVAVARLDCDGTAGVVAAVTVRSNGTADGTLTLTWFDSRTASRRGAVTVATGTARLPAGKTSFTGTYPHDFGADRSAYWGLAVSTDPAADTGDGSFLTVPACDRAVIS
ncbi:serine/threonine-protein kinase [Streptomyces sp. NPDC049040]|uniref:serine/threonine-protein kinase n=1 Tax=Streptomyces sp. NPDC049040 TaxID=3365593 RepID=UPI003711E027